MCQHIPISSQQCHACQLLCQRHLLGYGGVNQPYQRSINLLGTPPMGRVRPHTGGCALTWAFPATVYIPFVTLLAVTCRRAQVPGAWHTTAAGEHRRRAGGRRT